MTFSAHLAVSPCFVYVCTPNFVPFILIFRAIMAVCSRFAINCYDLENLHFLGIIIRSILLALPSLQSPTKVHVNSGDLHNNHMIALYQSSIYS